jgi:putative transport protein
MIDWFLDVLRHHHEVTFFLVLGIGYLLGKFRLGTFTLGAVTGTLLAGVIVGQLAVKVSDEVKQCFFLLFLFSIGFRTGPQFFRGLKSDGLQQAALAAIVATVGLIVAYAVSRAFGYNSGTAAGVIAGSLTESATIGTAGDAISRLPLPETQRAALTNDIPVAFAVTYLIGVIGAAWILAQLGPRILRVDLAEECRKLEEEMQGGARTGPTGRRDFEARSYVIEEGSRLIGRKVYDIEEAVEGARMFIPRLHRGNEVIESDDTTELKLGDTIVVSGRREDLVKRLETEGKARSLREVDDKDLLDIPVETVDVVVTSREFDGRTLGDLAHEEGARGLFLRKITRGGAPVAMFPQTRVNRGDVLTIVGSVRATASAAEKLGFADRASDVTDMVLVAAGIVVGAYIGIPALKVSGLEFGLSLSVGVLLGGLVCGWLRAVQPRLFGRIPTPTLWVFESIGLTGFVAIVGLNAGPDFVKGLQTSGLSLVLAGVLTVSIPHIVGIFVGRYVFHMHPGVMLGVCAGAGTATPALAAIQEAAKSAVPTLGYGVAYAVGNVLLALWGTVIVALIG